MESVRMVSPESPSPENVVEKKLLTEQLLELRFSQTWGSRLAEYITGMRPDDARMPERLIEDQKIIRAKYGLPSVEVRRGMSSAEYERILEDMARKNGTTIRDTSEHIRFFEDFSAAGALYADSTAFVRMDRSTDRLHSDSNGVLEHELIHGEQHLRYESMPVELREYEAYVAGGNPLFYKEYPEEIESIFFSWLVGASVRTWYEMQKKDGVSVEPVWDSPEYFLKNIDNISDEAIESYKQKFASDVKQS